MPAEADFGRFWADSGPPFGPIFGTFRHFLGDRDFDRLFIDFRITFREARAAWAGSAEAHSESADTKGTEGLRKKFHHALHPEGVRRILRASPPAAGPLELCLGFSDFWIWFWVQEGL